MCAKALDFYNKISGKSINIEDITTYDFYSCLAKEDAANIVALFTNKHFWDSLEPLPNSQFGIQTLIELGHRVVFATATDPVNFEWKIQWMQRYFPFVNPDDIIRIKDKSLLKADAMIDDHLDNLTSNICNRICIDYPWNRNKDKDFVYDIHRVNSWKSIVKYINQLERKEEKYE